MTLASEISALTHLETKLRALFALQERGGGQELVHSRAWVDGYMSALVETGVATNDELLAMVRAERTHRFGPGSRRGGVEVAIEAPLAAEAPLERAG